MTIDEKIMESKNQSKFRLLILTKPGKNRKAKREQDSIFQEKVCSHSFILDCLNGNHFGSRHSNRNFEQYDENHRNRF